MSGYLPIACVHQYTLIPISVLTMDPFTHIVKHRHLSIVRCYSFVIRYIINVFMFSSLTLLELQEVTMFRPGTLRITRNKPARYYDVRCSSYSISICSQCRIHPPYDAVRAHVVHSYLTTRCKYSTYTVTAKPTNHAGDLTGVVTIHFMMHSIPRSGMYFCILMRLCLSLVTRDMMDLAVCTQGLTKGLTFRMRMMSASEYGI